MIIRCPYCDRYTQHTEVAVHRHAHRYQCSVCKLARMINTMERAELLAEVAHRPPRSIGRYLA